MAVVIAVDAGTTGVRSLAVDERGAVAGWSYREFPQYFPQPGWVEHDPLEIWDAVQATLTELRAKLDADGQTVAAIGITDQRETVVVWDRRTGEPLHRAIVWQDRRTAERCDALRAAGHEPLVGQQTGLVLRERHRWRPAGGALRAGVLRAGRRQEHLRHRLVRADERRRHVPRPRRRAADDGGVDVG